MSLNLFGRVLEIIVNSPWLPIILTYVFVIVGECNVHIKLLKYLMSLLLFQKMNNLSFSELCCLFCCPPCPGKIASKLAFLPPDPTYTLMCDESGSRWTLHLSERADWQYSSREKDAIECFMTRTSKGNRIACMFVRCSPNAKYTLLFSHGNAVDLGQMSSFYIGLGSRINCNIFSYDYSGYGASSGKPTEKNLYADVEAAWLALRTR